MKQLSRRITIIMAFISLSIVALCGLCACQPSVTDKTCYLTYLADEGGSIIGQSNQMLAFGSDGTTVTAIPDQGYSFIGWSDGVQTAERTEQNLKSDLSVTAHFKKSFLTVNYITDGNGTIQGEKRQAIEYNQNTTTVSAIAKDGYVFSVWSDGVTTAERQDRNITEDLTVTAHFDKQEYQISYATDGNGSIRGEEKQIIKYKENSTVIVAVPNEGYRFLAWSDGVTTAERQERNVTKDIAVSAKFEKMTYKVHYGVENGGKIIGIWTQNVTHGENATEVTAEPYEGYEFTEWSDGVKTAIRLDRNIANDINVTAKFKKKIYDVTYITDGNGVLEGEAQQAVEHGRHASTITAVPNEGYEFVSWSDGIMSSTRTDTFVTQEINVTAVFRKKTFKVSYHTENVQLGNINDESGIQFVVEYGEKAPVVTAMPLQDPNGYDYVFFYWSDGVMTEERQDKNITEDLTVTAYFGYKVEYKVYGNQGGRIEGECYQTSLNGGLLEAVSAVPDDGYVFTVWSDFSLSAVRRDFFDPENNAARCWEYVAYFERIEKTFRYDYGIASGVQMSETKVTLNRNEIEKTEFVVPKYSGYKFCGWYADKDYRIKIVNENGKYMYGYAAFTLETDTLYARWEKVGEETDNHKILMIFVDEVQADIQSERNQNYYYVYDKMNSFDYEMSKWAVDTVYELLNEWFDGEVIFEVDAYFTTQKVGSEAFTHTELFAPQLSEVFDIMYLYHNTLTTVGYGGHEKDLLTGWSGIADIKDACVSMAEYWLKGAIIKYIPIQKFLQDIKNGEYDLSETIVYAYLHEFVHTAEMNFEFDYDLHTAESQSIRNAGKATMYNTVKPFLLGKFEMNGEMCGVPMEYWKHQINIHILYGDQPVNQRRAGRIVVIGEEEDPDRPPWNTGLGRYAVYGSDFSVEAIPDEGFRFVRWTDGITTAIRHDVNIIAYFWVYAIFEKI